MKHIAFVFLLFLMATRLMAQQHYFILLQSDDHQPFYVRMGSNTHNASSFGHLILADLKDSIYEVTVGFPHNLHPEQHFQVALNGSDHGFVLKQMENGWRLFDLQTMALLSPVDKYGIDPSAISFGNTKKTDAFSQMLANIVNDSAVLYTYVPPPQPATPAVDTALAVVTATPETPDTALSDMPDSLLAQKEDPVPAQDSSWAAVAPTPDTASQAVDSALAEVSTPAVAADTVQKAALVAIPDTTTRKEAIAAETWVEDPPAKIAQVMDISTGRGRLITYEDHTAGLADTIRILIPADTATAQAVVKTETASPPVTEEDASRKAAAEPVTVWTPAPDTPKAVMSTPVATDTVTGTQVAAASKPLPMINSDCRNFATDHDVDKLRVKLMAGKNVDEQLNAALKFFKEACYTSRQIRALSELFPSDEARFRFFKTAYPYISDTDQYGQVADMLTGEEYVKRFRELIGK